MVAACARVEVNRRWMILGCRWGLRDRRRWWVSVYCGGVALWSGLAGIWGGDVCLEIVNVVSKICG